MLVTVYQVDDGEHDSTDAFYNVGFDDPMSRDMAVRMYLPQVVDDYTADTAKQVLGVVGKPTPDWLYAQACRLMKQWFAEGCDPVALKVHFLGHIPDIPPHG